MLGKKLQSNRGMSILMGLLLLLVCATAGAAALTSAASNAGRYTHLRQDQQRYLAVASAARTVRDELCKGEYEVSATLTETYTEHRSGPDAEGNYSWYTTGPVYTMEPLNSSAYTGGSFGPWLKERLDQLFQAREIDSDWWTLAEMTAPSNPGALELTGLTVQMDGADPLLSRVKWSLTLGENDALTARFWLEEEDGGVYYNTTLTIPATKTSTETTASSSGAHRYWTTTTHTVTLKWDADNALIQQN